MASGAASRPHWRCAGQSIRGVAHVRKGLPNQDAVECSAEPSGEGLVMVAVADGHGGALHFRSDIGASAAVKAAVAVLFAAAPGEAVGEAILDAWRKTTLSHLAEHPFSESDLDRKGAEQLADNPLLAYGCTLLAAAVSQDAILYLQLGDGDILAIRPDGETIRVFPRDPRFASGQTVSLCQPDAANEFQIRVDPHSDARPALVLLSTDGYANSFQTEDDFVRIGKDYLALLGRDGMESVQERLPGFLTHASEAGSADDITLAILADMNAVRKIAPEEPLALRFLDSYGETAGNSGPRLAILCTCIVALLLLAAFFFFSSHADRNAAHNAPVPAVQKRAR